MHSNFIFPALCDSDLNYVISRVNNSFKLLNNKKLLITGVSGFIGSWMLETAIFAAQKLDINIEIAVVTRNKNSFLKRFPEIKSDIDFQIIECDIRNFNRIDEKFDYIIHAAAVYPGPETKLPDKDIIEIQEVGTKNIINSAYKNSYFLYISSGAVYNRENFKAPFTENHNLLNNNKATSYAKGKVLAENLVLQQQVANPDSTYTIARCFSFIGPRLDAVRSYAPMDFIRQTMQSGEINIKTDGQAIRSYMYSADLAVWLWKILFSGQKGGVYNVGCNEEISILDLAKHIRQTLSQNSKIKINHSVNTKNDYYVPNTTKAINELLLEKGFNLQETIMNTANYLKSCVL